MALRVGNYVSGLWSALTDPQARRAAQDVAQKLERLARDVNGLVSLPGEIRMFEDECPEGWSLVADLVDKFPRGAAEGAGGTAGGSDAHAHTFSATTGADGDYYNFAGGDGGTADLAAHPHTHSVSGSTASGSNVPAYYTVVYCRYDG